MTQDGTSTLAIIGVKWVTIGSLFERLYRIVTVAVLARLLVPEDFGLVAVGTLVVNFVGRVKHLGLHSALIRRRDHVDEAANFFFIFNMAVSVGAFALIWATADPLARFFGNGRAGPVLTAIAVQMLIEGAYSVHRTLTVRQLGFRKQTLIGMADSFSNATTAISLALAGFGVWALVGGILMGQLVSCSLWWRFSPWRPRTSFDRTVGRDFVSFGVRVTLASVLEAALDTANRSVIGRILGVSALGLYDMTLRVLNLPLVHIVSPGQRVALPAYCRDQHDLEQVGRWHLRLTRYACLCMAPVAVGLVLTADMFVPVVLGNQWLETVPMLRILAVYPFLMPLAFAWPVYVATGRLATLSSLMLIRLLVTLPAAVVAAQYSLLAVCGVEIASLAVLATANQVVVSRMLGIRLAAIARAVASPFVEATALAATVVVLRRLALGAAGLHGLPGLAAVVLPSAAVYLGVAWFRQPKTARELLGILSIMAGRSPGEHLTSKRGSR